MKYKFLVILIILMSALIVSAAVPLDISWDSSSGSDDTAMNVPFPGFVDEPTSTDPIPVTLDKPLLMPLATISKSLVDDLISPK